MNEPITAEQIFDASIRIQLCEKRSLEVDFSQDLVRVRLPSKRELARFCSVPMSKMTAILSEMEQNLLIGTELRGGMWATRLGNQIIADCLTRQYQKEAEDLLGPVVLKNLLMRLSSSPL
jgi:DNA-binding transcriptional regulator YhcF (GntR family)